MTVEHGRSSPEPAKRPSCLCGQLGEYDSDFDAYYCPVRGTWLENVCSDPTCEFCSVRPEKRS
jgi:hypothetical protein